METETTTKGGGGGEGEGKGRQYRTNRKPPDCTNMCGRGFLSCCEISILKGKPGAGILSFHESNANKKTTMEKATITEVQKRRGICVDEGFYPAVKLVFFRASPEQ